MTENFASGDLEAEIAELTKQIEAKKLALESSAGVVREDREIISSTVAEKFYDPASSASDDSVADDNQGEADKKTKVSKDYLDNLQPETVSAINAYVSLIPKSGIRKTIKLVQTEQPFMVDAFHDALVTRLYEELKQRGIIKT